MLDKLKHLFRAEPVAQVTQAVKVQTIDTGLSYTLPSVHPDAWLAAPFAYPEAAELGARLGQLHLSGLGHVHEQSFVLPWQAVHQILHDDELSHVSAVLKLPEPSSCRPQLTSHGSLTDPDFAIHLTGWVDGRGVPLRRTPKVIGATLEVDGLTQLMSPAVWDLVQTWTAFHRTPPAERDITFKESVWARMRKWAVAAHAPLSDYLEHTVIVTPERLKLDLGRRSIGDDRVVEVCPTFEGAPARWLEMFDRQPLQSSYSVPEGPTQTKVILSEPVRQVLAEIKRMPGRRVVGARAEAFVRNPFAALGPTAAAVLDADHVEQALAAAGVTSQRFTGYVDRDEKGWLAGVGIDVLSRAPDDNRKDSTATESTRCTFSDANELAHFCDRLAKRLQAGNQWCAWDEYDLELTPASIDELRQLQAWLGEWRTISLRAQQSALLNLANYSDRVSEFGVEKPYALPFLQQRGVDLDWFVDNVLFGLVVKPEGSFYSTLVTIKKDDLPSIKSLIDEATAAGKSEVQLPGAPAPIPIDDARRAIDDLCAASEDIREGTFNPDQLGKQEPKSESDSSGSSSKAERKQLVLKANIDRLEHAEERKELLALPAGAQPELPASLRPTTQLKRHQHEGVARLQHLWRHAPTACRGCLLADDMGLGKTLQLLTFVAACIEQEDDLKPVLVVAPVALLENWKGEVEKFFEAGSISVLTLYGRTLASLRLGPDEIDPELRELGLTKLLRPGWVGDARLVLTTYETLRDLEFTLASQDWSIMVCDEAQKIKNPSAMVTRAAMKQKVRFRVACTGTPVENSLIDLWCLFDFIQPGLLGALSQFQRTYKQPIEAKTEQQKARVAELRILIEPQTLRRTKMEVARDSLPRKLEDESCRALPMSGQQLSQYWIALDKLKQQREDNPSSVLQSLHYIRRICSDPHWQRPDEALRLPLKQVLDESPKMRWLVDLLQGLKRQSDPVRGEKIIIFCEFRDLQIQLQRVIREAFGLDVFVVNGDTSASHEVENSRQKLIDRFQTSKGFNTIVLSPLAVGFGVNIQAANHVIHFTRTWNPAKEDQATDRAYRIGQDRDVTVYYPSVVGQGFESFDTVLHRLLTWKRELAGDMLNAPGDLAAADFDL